MRTLLFVLLLALRVAAQPPAVAEETKAAKPLAEEVYPLTHCLITGQPLGSMGEPVQLDLHGVRVELCCAHCEAPAREREASLRKTLTKALNKRDRADYPLSECLACGQPLPRKAIPLVQGSTLLLVDRRECAEGLAEQGAAWALRVREARAAARP